MRLHDNDNRLPLDYARRCTKEKEFRKEIMNFLSEKQSKFTRLLDNRINHNSERYRQLKLIDKKPKSSIIARGKYRFFHNNEKNIFFWFFITRFRLISS